MKKMTSAAVLAASLVVGPRLLRAQDSQQLQATQNQTQEVKNQCTNNELKTSGLFLNTSQYQNDALTVKSVSETYLDSGCNTLWLVGGQTNTISFNGANQYTYDIGAKYVIDNKSQLRFTYVNTNGGTSYGADWDLRVTSFYKEKLNLSLLGDLSSVSFSPSANNVINYGIGGKVNFYTNHNFFALTSKRTASQTGTLRLGYMYLSKERIASFIVDHRNGAKDAYSAFLGLPKFRFIGAYDQNSSTFSSVTFASFGNGPMPAYARTLLLSNQYILTQRSVVDSDNTYGFQPPFFLSPKGAIGDFVRLIFNKNPKDRTGIDFAIYNATMFKRHNQSGVVLTENITEDTKGARHYGGGIGYKFLRNGLTPVITFQTGRVVTFNLNFKY
jgi:hypothetical protein